MPQWIGDRDARAQPDERLGGRRRVEVALRQARAPAPDRQQREVEAAVADLAHAGEQVGVAREEDGAAAGDVVAEARRRRPNGNRSPSCSAWVAVTVTRADPQVGALVDLDHLPESLRRSSAPAPRGTTIGISSPSFASEGGSR